jgi:uncharacterized membrane protein
MHETQETSKEIDPIGENIQTVADLHKRAESSASLPQRAIENATDFLGRPRFLFIILIVAAVWVVINILLMKLGLPIFDPPPFIWLQGLLTLGAVLQATMILITQNREDMVIERRTQLDLQVSLLLDQKMSKLIMMVDQLRRVHPELENGTDPQVEALKKTVDPHQSIKTLDQLLEEDTEQF